MTPDQLPPQSAEKEVPKPYEVAANAYMAKMADFDRNSDESFKATEDFINSILPADGEVIAGRKETFDREAIIDRFAIYFDQKDTVPDRRSLKEPSFVLTNTDGLRSAVEAVMANHETVFEFRQQMKLRIEELDKARDEAAAAESAALEAEGERNEDLRSDENMHDAGEAVLDASGIKEPIPDGGDPLVNAVQAASGIIDAVPSHIKQPIQPVPLPPPMPPIAASVGEASPVESKAPGEETELEMNERWLRETKAERDELYAQLRRAAPKSDDYYRIEKKIREATEDMGRFAGKAAKLKGHNWT